MIMRACRLAQPDNMPVACYRTKKAPLLFITSSRVATLLHEAVKKVQPSTSADKLKKYSAHSLRVWALSYLMRQACPLPSSKNVSSGEEIPSRCISVTRKPSRTSTLLLFNRYPPTLWQGHVWPSGWVVRKVAHGPGFEPSAKGGVSSKRA
jgi:hypothetical protein